jgi:hypothetical protein
LSHLRYIESFNAFGPGRIVNPVDIDADTLSGMNKPALTDIYPRMVAVNGKPDYNQRGHRDFLPASTPKRLLLLYLAVNPTGILTGYFVIRQVDAIPPEHFRGKSPAVKAFGRIPPPIDKGQTDQIM